MIQESTKHVVDAASVVAVTGALIGYLPALAALFTIIWTGIRIFETHTIQRFLNHFRKKKVVLKDRTDD